MALHAAINPKTILSAAASAMLVRTIVNDLIPTRLRSLLVSKLHHLFSAFSTQLNLVVEEFQGLGPNQIFEAAHVYLGAEVMSSTADRIIVGKGEKEKNLSTAMCRNQQIADTFGAIQVWWKLVCVRSSSTTNHGARRKVDEARSYEITFHKRHLQEVLNDYLPYVMERSKILRQNGKWISLHTAGRHGQWSREAIRLDHPMNFDNLAMDPELKKAVVQDLNAFVNRKAYYRRIGRAWRRSYLLYGPPGTGKSSLVAAMAKLLDYDIFYLDLTEVESWSELKSLLTSLPSRSMLVIEDIVDHNYNVSQTLSLVLKFTGGLRSCCADEQVMVFTSTADRKDGVDLLRPGRVDVQVRLSYCSFAAFRQLAFSYLQIEEHRLFPAVEKLLAEVEAAPAEIAGELMKSGEDVESAIGGVIELLSDRRSRGRAERDGEVDAGRRNLSTLDRQSYNLTQRLQESSRRGGLRRRGRPVRLIL